MATSFNKTYSVTVTFKKNDGSAITDADINAAFLRTDIQKRIAEVATRSKGIFECQPGSVSEV